MNSSKIGISVIIPNYNTKLNNLIECLEAVKASSLKPLEVVLVDDGSTIEYPGEIEAYCKIVKNKKNMGPAYSRYAGAKEASGDILCIVDSDVKIKQSTLAKIAEKFSNLDIAAIQTVYSKHTPVKNFISKYQNLYQHYNFINIKHEYICTLSSYAIAIKKDLFLKMGGQARYVKSASMEDEQLGLELYCKGYKILLAKDIMVEHLADFRLKKLLSRMYVMGRDNIKYFGKRNKMDLKKTHHNLSFIISILMSPLILFILISLRSPKGFLFLGPGLAIFLAVNAKFFLFLYQQKKLVFMLKSILLYYLVCLSAFFGCLLGGINYLVR